MSSPDGQLAWQGGVLFWYVGHLYVWLAWKICSVQGPWPESPSL